MTARREAAQLQHSPLYKDDNNAFRETKLSYRSSENAPDRLLFISQNQPHVPHPVILASASRIHRIRRSRYSTGLTQAHAGGGSAHSRVNEGITSLLGWTAPSPTDAFARAISTAYP